MDVDSYLLSRLINYFSLIINYFNRISVFSSPQITPISRISRISWYAALYFLR